MSNPGFPRCTSSCAFNIRLSTCPYCVCQLWIMTSSSSSSSTPTLPSTEEVKSEVVAATKSTLSGLRSLAAGGVGGICAVVVGHPFDLVKVRLQTADKGVYTGAIDVVRKTVAREGLVRVGRAWCWILLLFVDRLLAGTVCGCLSTVSWSDSYVYSSLLSVLTILANTETVAVSFWVCGPSPLPGCSRVNCMNVRVTMLANPSSAHSRPPPLPINNSRLHKSRQRASFRPYR